MHKHLTEALLQQRRIQSAPILNSYRHHHQQQQQQQQQQTRGKHGFIERNQSQRTYSYNGYKQLYY